MEPNSAEKVSIFITDDHPVLREGLISILGLQPNLEVVGDYGSGAQLLQALQIRVPDILLLDLQLSNENGEDIVPKLLRDYPDLKIIILTGNSSAYSARLLLDMGVHGYLLKNTEQHLLVEAIQNVYRDFIFISPELQKRLFRMSKQLKGEMTRAEDLTSREIQILKLIADEFTSQEIADQLRLSLRTVENHRLALMQKLGAKNMIGMVKKGILLGLIE